MILEEMKVEDVVTEELITVFLSELEAEGRIEKTKDGYKRRGLRFLPGLPPGQSTYQCVII